MHIPKKARRFLARIPDYLHLQLFLLLIAWPMLLMWGLPLSAASIVGNALFAPLLSLFLLLSSLIFFLELCSIPAHPFIFLLELVTSVWYKLLQIANRSWLWHFPQPPLLLTLLIIISAFAILHHKKSTPIKSTCAFILLFFGIAYTLKIQMPQESAEQAIPVFDDRISIRTLENKNVLIDRKASLGRRISAPSYVTYTLIPTFIKQGITHFEHVLVGKSSTMVFRSLAILIATLPVKNVYLPAGKKSLKNSGWSSWENLLTTAARFNTRITIVTQPYEIPWGNSLLHLKPKGNILIFSERKV